MNSTNIHHVMSLFPHPTLPHKAQHLWLQLFNSSFGSMGRIDALVMLLNRRNTTSLVQHLHDVRLHRWCAAVLFNNSSKGATLVAGLFSNPTTHCMSSVWEFLHRTCDKDLQATALPLMKLDFWRTFSSCNNSSMQVLHTTVHHMRPLLMSSRNLDAPLSSQCLALHVLSNV